jgi:hypothetical protein
VLCGDAGLQQVIQDAGEDAGGAPAGSSLPSAFATRLKVRPACRQVSWCGPCFQSSITPSRAWTASGSAISAACTSVRKAGRRLARVSSMPRIKVRTRSWRWRTPVGRSTSIRSAMPGASAMPSAAASGMLTAARLAMEVERGIDRRLRGRDDHREVGRAAARQHHAGGHALQRRLAHVGRDEAERDIAVAAAEHRLGPVRGRRDDGQAVGPAALELSSMSSVPAGASIAAASSGSMAALEEQPGLSSDSVASGIGSPAPRSVSACPIRAARAAWSQPVTVPAIVRRGRRGQLSVPRRAGRRATSRTAGPQRPPCPASRDGAPPGRRPRAGSRTRRWR